MQKADSRGNETTSLFLEQKNKVRDIKWSDDFDLWENVLCIGNVEHMCILLVKEYNIWDLTKIKYVK